MALLQHQSHVRVGTVLVLQQELTMRNDDAVGCGTLDGCRSVPLVAAGTATALKTLKTLDAAALVDVLQDVAERSCHSQLQ